MIGLLSFLIVSSPIDFSGGYAFSVFKTREAETKRTVLDGRQDFLHLGLGFQIAEYSGFDVDIRPEVLFQNSYIGTQVWLGAESVVEIGPRQDSFYLFGALGLGPHFSYFIRDPLSKDESRRLTVSERSTMALGTQFSFGPQFRLNRDFALSFRNSLNFYFGKIAETSFRSTWSSKLGLTYGLALELSFRLPENDRASGSRNAF